MDMQTDTQGNPYLLYFKNSCMVVSDQSIMVKEYDPLTRSSRQYTLDVDISNTIARQYSLVVQDAPYLIVTGRSTEDGTSVSFKINLLNGENNASFSPDARKVTSFFRIN